MFISSSCYICDFKLCKVSGERLGKLLYCKYTATSIPPKMDKSGLDKPRETNKTSHIIYELGILCSYNNRLPVSKVTNNFSSPTAKNLTDVFITVKLLISRMPIKCLASDKKRIIILFPLHTTKAVSFLASLIIKR